MSDSDAHRHQIMTYNVGSRTERVKEPIITFIVISIGRLQPANRD